MNTITCSSIKGKIKDSVDINIWKSLGLLAHKEVSKQLANDWEWRTDTILTPMVTAIGNVKSLITSKLHEYDFLDRKESQ